MIMRLKEPMRRGCGKYPQSVQQLGVNILAVVHTTVHTDEHLLRRLARDLMDNRIRRSAGVGAKAHIRMGQLLEAGRQASKCV